VGIAGGTMSAARWSRTTGYGCAALVSAVLWLVIAGLAWWGLYD
jgi:hypothetical protein